MPAPVKKSKAVSKMTSEPVISKVTLLDHEQLQRRIRQKAYEIYLQRGCQDGYAEEDWLVAERFILANANFINYNEF